MVHRLDFLQSLSLYSLIGTLTLITGCSDNEPIRTQKEQRNQEYELLRDKVFQGVKVPKSEPVRILGAILPVGEEHWYFKAMGSPEEIQTHIGEFDQFIHSIQFDGTGSEPSWKVPSEWRQAPNNQFSKAAFFLDGNHPESKLKLTVSLIGGGMLANLNRWRTQIGLPEIGVDKLSDCTEIIKLANDRIIYKFDQVGKSSGQGMAPPFARGN